MKKSNQNVKKQFILLFCFLLFVPKSASAKPIDDNYQLQRTVQTKYVDKYFEVDENGDFKMHVFIIGGGEIATVGNEENITYPLTDHLGSPTIVTNQAGQVVETNDYESYGQLKNTNTQIDNDYKFTGKEQDEENSLQYYGARYYDNSIGKFISVDPASINSVGEYLSDPQQLNSYSYGRNNPVVMIDFDGRRVWDFQPYFARSNYYDFGELFGNYKGTDIISAGKFTGYTDHNYQCVDLVKNFIYDQFGVDLGLNTNSKRVGNAIKYADQATMDKIMKSNGNSGYMTVYKNGSRAMPQENDIITWSEGSNDTVGHVGVIVEVSFDEQNSEGIVYSMEQNFSKYKTIFSQSFTRNSNGEYNVGGRGGYEVYAWAHYGSQNILPDYTRQSPLTRESIYNN